MKAIGLSGIDSLWRTIPGAVLLQSSPSRLEMIASHSKLCIPHIQSPPQTLDPPSVVLIRRAIDTPTSGEFRSGAAPPASVSISTYIHLAFRQ